MNRRKHYLYNHQEYTKTIDLWLKKYKGKKIIWLEKYKRILGIRTLPKRRHRRYFISCRLPKLVGNRVVYRLFKATVWYKAPNTKCRREEKYYQEEAYQERIEERRVL